MPLANDFYLAKNEDGVFDLAIEDGNFKTTYSFNTSLDMIFYCERRADAHESPLPQYRRGWWGNEILFSDGYEIGSKMWLLSQSRVDDATLSKAVDYLQTACQWLVDDNHLSDVKVRGSFITERGFRLGFQLAITFTTIDGKVDSRYYDLWKNVGDTAVVNKATTPEFIIQEDTVAVDPTTGVAYTVTGGRVLVDGYDAGSALVF